MNFKKYKRKEVAELREVTLKEINTGLGSLSIQSISVSNEDIKSGSPKIGDMIARNPKNHNDQWLVAKKYFEENFEEL